MCFRSILALPILALTLSLGPTPLVSLAEAGRIAAPGLHVKAWEANNETDAFWPTDPILCDLVLDGNIEEGDAAVLEQKFETIVGTRSAFTFFLCLRSTGGDLKEAVKIAQFVLRTQRPSIATVIEDGQICASACAIIFLAGNAPARVGAFPQRFLHPRGRLLYHSSQYDLSKFSDNELLALLTKPTSDSRGLKGQLLDLYKDGLRDVESVIATFQSFIYEREDLGDRWVRPSLFLEMFAQDPDEWICVDNVDAVGRWNIQVYGYQPPKPPKKQNYSNLCRAAYHWRSDNFAVGADSNLEEEEEFKGPPASTRLAGRNKSNAEFDDRFIMSFQAPSQPLTCVVELKYKGYSAKKQLNAQTQLTTFFVPNGSWTPGSVFISELAPTAFYPPATLLRDLPGVRPAPNQSASKTRPPVSFTQYTNTVLNGCSYKSIPKMDRSACQAACAVDTACQAYSHNKVSQACELKHTLTARRLDPLWTSGVPSTSPAPGRSIRNDVMVPYYATGNNKNPKIEGKLLDEEKVDSVEVCSNRCKSDPTCLALEYGKGVCRRFSEVTALREEPAKESIDTEIKRQR